MKLLFKLILVISMLIILTGCLGYSMPDPFKSLKNYTVTFPDKTTQMICAHAIFHDDYQGKDFYYFLWNDNTVVAEFPGPVSIINSVPVDSCPVK